MVAQVAKRQHWEGFHHTSGVDPQRQSFDSIQYMMHLYGACFSNIIICLSLPFSLDVFRGVPTDPR